jgi:molecular chaperone GrpE
VIQSNPEKENFVTDKENLNKVESEDVAALKKALEEERAKCEANLAGWQRAQADFINYKRFVEQEKAEIYKQANASLILSLLPVLDDFERALSAIPSEIEKQNWIEGLKLIDRKFRDILEKQGVKTIEAIGEEFDPRFMEAMASAKGKKDVVVQVLEKGYMLNDKVIRPAKVIVGNGEEEANKEE